MGVGEPITSRAREIFPSKITNSSSCTVTSFRSPRTMDLQRDAIGNQSGVGMAERGGGGGGGVEVEGEGEGEG